MATPQLSINRDDLRARAASASAGVQQARAQVLESRADLRRRLEESLAGVELEPAARRVQIRYWQTIRSALGVLFAGPRVLVQGLQVLSRLADDMTDRGEAIAERGRVVAGRIPRSRVERRRSRLRTIGWAAGAFSLGFVVGWLLGNRPGPAAVYDPYDDIAPPTQLPDAITNSNGDEGGTAGSGSGTSDRGGSAATERTDADDVRSDSSGNER